MFSSTILGNSGLSSAIDVLGYDSDAKARIRLFLARLFSERPSHLLDRNNAFDFMNSEAPLLIIYPDHITSINGPPSLKLIDAFLDTHFNDVVFPVYMLPCWKSTGDGGFSIAEHRELRPGLGSLEDLKALINKRPTIIDLVMNHVSSQHSFLNEHLQTSPDRQGVLAEVDEHLIDLRSIPVSHRGHPTLSRYSSPYGNRWIWTTFSPGQVDIDYRSPVALEWLFDTLVFYLTLGFSGVRLDAVGFTWKEALELCIHAPQCHALVKLVRAFADGYHGNFPIIAQADYQSNDYIGDGSKEAHFTYRHESAPLILHSVITGRTEYLQAWISSLSNDPSGRWINFITTHDGIYLRPWDYPLPESEIELLVDACIEGGGTVEYYAEGGVSLPATLCSATRLLLEYRADEELSRKRLILAHAILLALPGVPAIYFSSLLGMKNWQFWQDFDSSPRSILRERYDACSLETVLSKTDSFTSDVFGRVRDLIVARVSHQAFRPAAEIKTRQDSADCVVSWTRGEYQDVLCMFNLGSKAVEVPSMAWQRSLVGEPCHGRRIILPPLSFAWLSKSDS